MEKISWHTWVREYFFKGKTIGVYLLMALFAVSIVELTLNRILLGSFIPLAIMTIFSYGLFTDLVAHLWFDNYDTGITYKAFVKLVLKGRTHDLYGLIVYLILLIYASRFIGIWSLLLFALAIGITVMIIKTKFYH